MYTYNTYAQFDVNDDRVKYEIVEMSRLYRVLGSGKRSTYVHDVNAVVVAVSTALDAARAAISLRKQLYKRTKEL
jgi:hypothetical protein